MNQDAGYAIVALGVIVGGGVLSKAALDEFLGPKKPAAPKERLPLTPFDRTVQFGLSAFLLGGTLMKLYDWINTGKAPKIEEWL